MNIESMPAITLHMVAGSAITAAALGGGMAMGLPNVTLWAVMIGVWIGAFYAAMRIDMRLKAAKNAANKEVGT